ncbi:MAG: hypothetical protein ACJ75G_08280 [Gaiellaceae bacterium]
MSLRDWFRNVFSGPPRVADAGDEGAEIDAAMREEELATPGPPGSLPPYRDTVGGGLAPSRPGTPAGAEAAENEIEAEEAPPDPTP